MRLPLSVLMYQMSDDYDYDAVNVDVSSSYDGIKLFDEGDFQEDEGKYLYLISEDELMGYHNDFAYSQILSASVFMCLCSGSDSAVCTECADLSVVFIYTEARFAYIFNKLQDIVKKADMWEKSFHLSILKKRSIQELVDITEELMTHPFIILDNNYALLGRTRDMSEVGGIMGNIMENGYATPDDLRELKDIGMVSDFDSFESPEINCYEMREDGVNYSIVYKFVANGRIVACAIAFHCISPPENGYLYLMNMIAERFQLYFEQYRFTDNSTAEAYQTFLTSILSNPDTPEKQLADRASHISGLSPEGSFILAQLKYNNINPTSYSFISWSLRNSMPEFMPFVFRDNFYILKDNSIASERTKFINDKEKEAFYKCFNNIDFVCGVSKPFFSLSKMRIAASQCREAISMGKLIKGEEEFYYYEDIAFYYMLMQLKKVMPMEMVESPYYVLLKNHDKKNGSYLCDVFQKYLLNGCSVTKTAAATYMHRNTILNKVKKSMDIMENDFENFRTQFFFIVSYIADHYTML